ncbi:MAG: hypothetical protein NXY57DRAFT_1041744 [Lentinula lateritia]|nr:MAG: hypothetical protein NXY57DRAFT_1041744 [Lentinula lateritia]
MSGQNIVRQEHRSRTANSANKVRSFVGPRGINYLGRGSYKIFSSFPDFSLSFSSIRMSRSRLRDPRKRRCTCDECCESNSLGIELPLDILRSHARKQRIQQVFKSPITNDPTFSGAPVASVSSSSHDIVALSDPSTSSSVSSNTQDITPNNQSEEPAVVDHSMQPNDSSKEPAIVDHGMRLETLEEELNICIAALQDADSRLDFVQQPSSEKSFIFPDPETILKVNCGPFALSSTYPRNRCFLKTEARLCFLLRELHQDHVRSNPADWERMEDLLYSALEKLHRMKGREWELQASSGLTQYIVHNQPIRQMRVVLSLLRALTKTLTRRVKPEIRTSLGQNIAQQIPKDIHTVIDYYDLDPSCRTFNSCRRCHALYPLTNNELSANEDAYAANKPLSSCTSRSHPTSAVCGTALWKTRSIGPKKVIVPVQKQVFHNLKDWIGRLLAIPESIGDFTESRIFREFLGRDGQPFMRTHVGISGSPELRLLMSLGFDSFNPFHIKASGSVSSTAMYMVLLNLPEHLRYRQEYMFLVTVMPGHPNEDQGRSVSLAVLPAVCDAEGAHSLSGFASHEHTYFCVRCLLPKNDIHNLKPETWPRRELEEHRKVASLWRDAPSIADRDKIFKDYGVRWSELLRLPYWNPITFTLIDSMHMGYLGLFSTHIRKIWKMDAEKPKSGEGHSQPTFAKKRTKPSNLFLRELLRNISENSPSLRTRLSHQSQPILWYLCYDLGLRSTGNKESLVNNILEWREQVGPDGVPSIPPLTYEGVVIDDGHEEDEASQASDSDVRDPEYVKLIDRTQDGTRRTPALSNPKRMLQALCRGLRIYYNEKEDHNIHLQNRLKIYHAEQVAAQTDENLSAPSFDMVHFLKLKERFEEKEPLKATLMGSDYNKDQLARLCRSYGIPPFSTNSLVTPVIPSKLEMATRLILWRRENRDSVLVAKEGATSKHVIAKDLLEVIWEDSKNTVLPSWIDAPPHNWGTKAAGKLSADEWKVVCSISLVVTLIRVWGYKYQHDPQSRHYQLLLNFLDMVHAIQLLNLHETSSQIRQDYHSLILKYLRTVLILFPDVSLKPNHHYAIHIAEDLELMGPVHAHNTPVFERTNHTLQELNLNQHLGEVEATMLKVYCQQGNLEMMLAHCSDYKDDIQEALDALDEIKRESHRGMFDGTDLSSWSSPDRKFKSSPITMESSTLDQIIELLCVQYQVSPSTWEGALTRDALLLAGVAHDGVVFSPKIRENSIVF